MYIHITHPSSPDERGRLLAGLPPGIVRPIRNGTGRALTPFVQPLTNEIGTPDPNEGPR